MSFDEIFFSLIFKFLLIELHDQQSMLTKYTFIYKV